MNPIRILTWHIHGNYLYYLTQTNFEFYIPVTYTSKPGYKQLPQGLLWGKNVHIILASEVKKMYFDCIIFQSNYNLNNPNYNYLNDQISVLSKKQIGNIPKIFIEHDPPRKHPTDTKHILYNSTIPIVHVTFFNQLMWDCGSTPTTVIEHGVTIPPNVGYTGYVEKGIVVVNSLSSRGRRLGLDIFEKIRKSIPLDLVGTESEVLGGLGELPGEKLPETISKYRFFFHPARYTSLGLSVIEAMMVGLPIIGLATTELATVIQTGKNGYIHTNSTYLISYMKSLLSNPSLAKMLGEKAKKTAEKKFSIHRFTSDWEKLIRKVEKNKKIEIGNEVLDISSNFRYL